MDQGRLWLFVGAAITLAAVPGPGVLFIVARSVDLGRRAGMVSVLGVAIGNFAQVVVAALGLSAIITSTPWALEVVRVAGAAYLIWLGIARLRAGSAPQVSMAAPTPQRRLLRQGIIVAALNPKTALFFLAFLPQFVAPGGGPVTLQIMLLGGIFVAIALIGDCLYALTAGTIALRLRGRSSAPTASRYATAGVYFLLGFLALLGSRPSG